MAARRDDGTVVGWAALDHVYHHGALVGAALNAVRYDPAARGVAALLALEGGELVRRAAAEAEEEAEEEFVLFLGESPLAPTADLGARHADPRLATARRSRFLDTVFDILHRRANAVYNTAGIASWKSKFRAEERPVTYACVSAEPPLRETAAFLSLLVV